MLHHLQPPLFPSRSNPQPIKDGRPGRGRPGRPAEEPKRGNPVPAPFGKGSPPHEPQRPRRRVRKTRGHRSYMAGISAFTPAASLPQMVPGRGTASPPRPATQSAFSPAERQKPRSDTEVKIEKISEMESGATALRVPVIVRPRRAGRRVGVFRKRLPRCANFSAAEPQSRRTISLYHVIMPSNCQISAKFTHQLRKHRRGRGLPTRWPRAASCSTPAPRRPSPPSPPAWRACGSTSARQGGTARDSCP